MGLIEKHFWVICIVFTFLNVVVLKNRTSKYVSQTPQLKEGYNSFFKAMIIYANIPWLIVGIGTLSGQTSSVFDYFHPRQLNPIVLLFHLSIIVLWVLIVRWIYFKNGAEFIEKHPGLVRFNGFTGSRNVTSREVRTFAPLALAGGILGMIMMWVTDF